MSVRPLFNDHLETVGSRIWNAEESGSYEADEFKEIGECSQRPYHSEYIEHGVGEGRTLG